jgi:hypothetical protein
MMLGQCPKCANEYSMSPTHDGKVVAHICNSPLNGVWGDFLITYGDGSMYGNLPSVDNGGIALILHRLSCAVTEISSRLALGTLPGTGDDIIAAGVYKHADQAEEDVTRMRLSQHEWLRLMLLNVEDSDNAEADDTMKSRYIANEAAQTSVCPSFVMPEAYSTRVALARRAVSKGGVRPTSQIEELHLQRLQAQSIVSSGPLAVLTPFGKNLVSARGIILDETVPLS